MDPRRGDVVSCVAITTTCPGQVTAIRDTAQKQVTPAELSAREQRDVTERMTKDHIDMLREDLRARLLLHYETQWGAANMIEQGKCLAKALMSSIDRGTYTSYEGVSDDVPNFFESVGLILGRGPLDPEMVWYIFSYYAMRYGQALGPSFVADREAHRDPHLWSGFPRSVRSISQL